MGVRPRSTAILLLLIPVLSACGVMGNLGRNFGTVYPEGTTLDTDCVSVTSFDRLLRSSPGNFSADSYVGYLDFGPGWSRGTVFVILPLEEVPGTPGELLQRADPKHRAFWLQATLVGGAISPERDFDAFVPPKQHQSGPNVTIVERAALLIRGRVRAACGKYYLVAAHADLSMDEARERAVLGKDYDRFLASLRWPEQ